MFRKFIFLAACVGLVSGSAAKAEELVPLQKFLLSNSTPISDNSFLYVYSRCTALFTMLTAVSPNDITRQLLELKALQFLVAAADMQAKLIGIPLNDANSRVMKTVKLMGHKYVDSANEDFVTKGIIIGNPLIDGDFKLCVKIVKWKNMTTIPHSNYPTMSSALKCVYRNSIR